MAVTEANKEAIWLRRLYNEILSHIELSEIDANVQKIFINSIQSPLAIPDGQNPGIARDLV